MAYPFRELPKQIAKYFKVAEDEREGEKVHIPAGGREITFTDDENVGDWDPDFQVEYIMWTGEKWYISCVYDEVKCGDQDLLDYLTVWPAKTPVYQGKKV
jgi:hypothetical protein